MLERGERIEQRGPSTMEVIANRICTGSKRGQRDDPWKVCLLVEGGGMAGIITAEMLAQLAQYDPNLDSIDIAAGNSAGILNLIYVLSDQGDGKEIDKGRGIYPRLVKPPFYNPRRMVNVLRNNGKPPVIDMKHLIYDVMGNDIPVQWDRIAEKGLPIDAYITSPANAQVRAVDLSTIRDKDRFLKTIELSSTIPVYGGFPDPEGTDGGVGSKGPSIREVLGDPDVTHVLALLSRPEGVKIADFDPLKSFAAQVLRWHDLDDLAFAMSNWNKEYKANLRLMSSANPLQPGPGNPYIEKVQVPRGRREIGVMEMNEEKLKREAPFGRNAVANTLGPLLAAGGHVFP